MPIIQPSEKSDIKRRVVAVARNTRVILVVAAARTPATATIAVSRIDDHSGVRSWQISDSDFIGGSGRVQKEVLLRDGDQFQIDFFAYASGADAEILFKIIDAEGNDRYRQYRVNDGKPLFSPWGAVGVLTGGGAR